MLVSSSSLKWMIPHVEPPQAITLLKNLIWNTYFHELGHAVCIKAFYRETKVSIHLGIDNGYTERVQTYPEDQDNPKLTTLGSFLGRRVTTAMIAAAGPLVDCVTEVCLGILAKKLEARFPCLAKISKLYQFAILVAATQYAFRSLSSREDHDYKTVSQQTGIPCLVFALGLLTRLGYVYCQTNIFPEDDME